MPRVKRGTVRRAKRKKLLKRAKGFYATKSKLYQAAQEAVDKALNYAYSGRRRKKRDFRRLWVVRINAAARLQRPDLRPAHQRPQGRRRRARSQEPRRPGREPSGRVRDASPAQAQKAQPRSRAKRPTTRTDRRASTADATVSARGPRHRFMAQL